jgi:hypothetical protein
VVLQKFMKHLLAGPTSPAKAFGRNCAAVARAWVQRKGSRRTSKGPDGCFLDGCPWDAIVMVETTEVEKEVGAMPI